MGATVNLIANEIDPPPDALVLLMKDDTLTQRAIRVESMILDALAATKAFISFLQLLQSMKA